MPAIWDTPTFGVPAQPGRLLAAASYGYVEPLEPVNDGAFHRVGGALAGAYTLSSGFGAELHLSGRYQTHTSAGQTDTSAVGEPRLMVRYGRPFLDGWSVGLDATVWVPGGEAPSLQWSATTVDLLAGVTRTVGNNVLSFGVGYRMDRSEEALPLAVNETVSVADWVALGASSSNAVLVRVGTRHQLGAMAVLVDWRSDLLVGSAAPGAGRSPHVLTAGVQYALTEPLTLTGALHVLASGREAVTVGGAATPVHPRVAASVALSFAWGADGEDTVEATAEDVALPSSRPVVVTVTVDGIPLEGASVEVEGNAVDTDAQGVARLPSMGAGTHALKVTADGYLPHEESVRVAMDRPAHFTAALQAIPPLGALRVLVRDARTGRPIQASVRALSDGVESASADTTGPDGVELELPPGRYTVELRAPGYRKQERPVKIEDGGVTLLNAALRRARR